tara:strand:+ start:1204 stop:1587 length:384 start_codon:yes stop_codon:yes gene_type:complete
MRKIERQTVSAVRDLLGRADFSGQFWRSGNMSVLQTHHGIAHTPGYERTIEVRLHDNLICKIFPSGSVMDLSDCGWRSTTTKSRLNVILDEFAPGYGIFQKNFNWFFQVSQTSEPEKWRGQLSVPMR